MQIVAIHGWQTASPELVQALAAGLGILPFEARQRLLAGSPAVVALYAETAAAATLAQRLRDGGFAVQVIDRDRLRTEPRQELRRFAFGDTGLQLELADGSSASLPYAAIDLLLAGFGIQAGSNETVAERKFSFGRTLLAGGVPMTKRVTRQEPVTHEERSRCLYLYAGDRPPLVCRQPQLDYTGLGAALQLTQEANFSHFLSELRRLAPQARLDERLLHRATQARLLGPLHETEPDLDLAATILAGALRG